MGWGWRWLPCRQDLRRAASLQRHQAVTGRRHGPSGPAAAVPAAHHTESCGSLSTGRVSTEDWQDPVTSRARQRDQAAAPAAGHGVIVAAFFDVGESRTLPWTRRPQAAALVAALADPDRGWDAIVIGEYERAFYGGQYASMAPLFEHYGIQLWMPEAGGAVRGGGDHEQLMLALGLQSKREITRTRIRVRTAMAAQTREQGRCLGGRPPTGAGAATPAPPAPIRAARRTPTSARTRSCRAWPLSPSSSAITRCLTAACRSPLQDR